MAASVATRRAGKFGKVLIGTLEFNVTSWKASHKTGKEPVTSTGDNGKSSYVDGEESFEFTLEAVWDSGNSPYAAGLVPGRTANTTTLKLFIDRTSTTPEFSIPGPYIETVEVDNDAKGVVKASIKGSNNGDFTVGTEAAGS